MSLTTRYILLTLVLIPLSSSSTPMPTPMSAIHLFSACKSASSREYAQGFCDGTIDAAYSSIQNWCVPGEVTHKEVSNHIKRKLLKKIPPVSVSANKFIADVINKKWPCTFETYSCTTIKHTEMSASGKVLSLATSTFNFKVEDDEIIFEKSSLIDNSLPFMITYLDSSKAKGVTARKWLDFRAETKYARILFDDKHFYYSTLNPSNVRSFVASCVASK